MASLFFILFYPSSDKRLTRFLCADTLTANIFLKWLSILCLYRERPCR